MSEVRRFYAELAEENDYGGFVLASDFDRVTAERDALQALLTAADEWADVLTKALNEAEHVIGCYAPPTHKVLGVISAALKTAGGCGDDWKSWDVGNTVRYQGSGQDGEDCYCGMTKGADYLIHEAPDDHESMVVLDDDGDELCVLVGEFQLIKP